MELYPRIGSFDLKTWTNCRVGMMGWSILTLCYAAKQAALLGGMPSPSMLVSVGLIQVYLFKFFLWETGYWASMDIAHDRAGFYLCWGCLVWVPSGALAGGDKHGEITRGNSCTGALCSLLPLVRCFF
jgi:7-dehydrocholesterol reductase